MKNTSKIVTGGVGPERLEYLTKYIDSLLVNKEEKRIIIYDSTYGLVKLAQLPYVKYFCVDSVLGYLEYLKSIKELDHSIKTYIISDAYAGLFYSSINKNLIIDIIKNKETYNIDLLLIARHLDYIPSEIVDIIDERIDYKDVLTLLANTK